MVINPSAAMAGAPDRQISATTAKKLRVARLRVGFRDVLDMERFPYAVNLQQLGKDFPRIKLP
jgi:hypothetical protein